MPKLQSHCGIIENAPIDPNFWLGSYFMTHHQNMLAELDRIIFKKSMGEKNTLVYIVDVMTTPEGVPCSPLMVRDAAGGVEDDAISLEYIEPPPPLPRTTSLLPEFIYCIYCRCNDNTGGCTVLPADGT